MYFVFYQQPNGPKKGTPLLPAQKGDRPFVVLAISHKANGWMARSTDRRWEFGMFFATTMDFGGYGLRTVCFFGPEKEGGDMWLICWKICGR